MKIIHQEYLRSALFGIEDSLVSTTGLIAGISVGADNRSVVILAGLVAVAIEAVSMGAGEYLSDDAVQDLDKLKRHKDNPLLSGAIMFVAYLAAGFVPLAPVIIAPFPYSVVLSTVLALIGLYVLGYGKGKLIGVSPNRGGIKILIVGGLATLLGIMVGLLFRVG